METNAPKSETQLYATHLEHTLKELQRKVDEHEAELRRLRASTDEEAPLSPEGQASVIRTALEDMNNSEPFLPSPGSALPALIALRKTHQTIAQSRAHHGTRAPEVDRLKRQVESDTANLRDHQLLAEALGARVESLRIQLEAESETRPEEGARKRVKELETKVSNYDAETARLMRALLAFIESHLATMLAAEELGGPVVGNVMDLDPKDLAAGFNAQGKLGKAKEGAASHDKRQRRLDEIWGMTDAQGARNADEVPEVAAAGKEMQQLLEELLNALTEAKGDNSASYVKLGRESAAARFLVRSKVAQFHPKDATRLRLVDFGRELED
ncbi:hypothetical protein HIM_02510 [Hirsutella minnesotensis 3608]|nr:hypothetical protein HIM_02510 [Hirsutella minnesotensis 3608]